MVFDIVEEIGFEVEICFLFFVEFLESDEVFISILGGGVVLVI